MDNCLEDLQYSVFGLGNKQYEHFNAMGKATNKFLEKLGGTISFHSLTYLLTHSLTYLLTHSLTYLYR
jgi:sulfite reductase alpha subunit-like flavoprotein